MEWISVEDRLPEYFGWFLVFDGFLSRGNEATMGFFEGKESSVLWLPLDQRDEPDSMIVTHWMPLPEPPQT
jgi:hypothetical protein